MLNQIITVTMIHLEDTITFSALLLGGERSNYNVNSPSATFSYADLSDAFLVKPASNSTQDINRMVTGPCHNNTIILFLLYKFHSATSS